MKIQPVKGTRDFYPETMAFNQWLVRTMRATAELFGFEAFDGPILEPFELYAAKSGAELVNQQSFVFEDRGGRKIVLRPELTPSLARMVAQQQQSLPKPIKWYSVGPMWRYEQPQKGRSREFYQWNVDCLGNDSPLADAEIVGVAIAFLQNVGLTSADFYIKVNDRSLFETAIMGKLGIDAALLAPLLHLVARIYKMAAAAWQSLVVALGISPSVAEQLHTILRTPLTADQLPAGSTLAAIVDYLTAMGYADVVVLDPSIVRGLDYYTGMVFEICDRKGELRAIGGGGRYKNLVEQVGGEALSGVGFAIGDMPMQELLLQVGKMPTDLHQHALALVTVSSPATMQESITIASMLRSHGIAVETYLFNPENPASLDKQLKYANQKHIPNVLVVGPEALAKGEILVKNFVKNTQEHVARADIVKTLQV